MFAFFFFSLSLSLASLSFRSRVSSFADEAVPGGDKFDPRAMGEEEAAGGEADLREETEGLFFAEGGPMLVEEEEEEEEATVGGELRRDRCGEPLEFDAGDDDPYRGVVSGQEP